MGHRTIEAESVGEAYLALLADRGIDYLFGNSGTDFPSIIEGLAKAAGDKTKAPIPVTVPHENLAVAMAHGYYAVTGRPQAVMFHVNVGTANGIAGVLNAARDNVPILFTAGRTPINESDAVGARSVLHPLGPGDVRSSWHAARGGQMGLRAAHFPAARNRRRPRAQPGHD